MKRLLIALGLVLVAVPSQAALAVVQHVLAKQGSGTPSSLNVTVSSTGSGNLLVAAVTTFNTPAHNPSGVTDGTTSFTQFTSARVTGTGTFAGAVDDVYYLSSSNSGKTTITLNVGTATQFLEIEVWEVSGFTTVAEDGTQNLGTGGSTCVLTVCTGAALTTSGTTGFVIGHNGTNAGSTVQNPQTGNEFTSGGDASGDGFVSLISSTAASHTPVWTTNTSGDQFTSATTGFKESSGAPACTPTLTLLGVGRCG